MKYEIIYKDKKLLEETGTPVLRFCSEPLFDCRMCGTLTAFQDSATGNPVCSEECYTRFNQEYLERVWKRDADARDGRQTSLHDADLSIPLSEGDEAQEVANLLHPEFGRLWKEAPELAQRLYDETKYMSASETLAYVYSNLRSVIKA